MRKRLRGKRHKRRLKKRIRGKGLGALGLAAELTGILAGIPLMVALHGASKFF